MEINITPQGFQKVTSGMSSEELDKPVDAVVETTPEPAVAPAAEPKAEIVPEAASTEEVEEAKVPKSRFLTMHSRAIEAEKLLAQERAERAQQTAEPAHAAVPTELPNYWIEMFGDSEASVQAFEAEQARLAAIEEKAADRAFERLTSREKEEEARTQEIVQSFDKAFEELGIGQDHEFTDEEQVAILDVVEELSPKDKDGKLLREFLLPLDKAYEIYSVRNEAKSSGKRAARDSVAGLTGARSEGSASTPSAAPWQPGQWRNKVP